MSKNIRNFGPSSNKETELEELFKTSSDYATFKTKTAKGLTKVSSRPVFVAESESTTYHLFYPLTGRMQEVSKSIFSRVEGKVFRLGKSSLIRVNYPENYPSAKKIRSQQIRSLLNMYVAEGLLETSKQVISSFKTISTLVNSLSHVIEVVQKTDIKKMLIKVSSICIRLIDILARNKWELIPILSLLADIYVLQDDFVAEGLEDLALHSLINMLPQKLKAFALLLITSNKRDVQFIPGAITYVCDLFMLALNFLSELNLPDSVKNLLEKGRDFVLSFGGKESISSACELVVKYKKNPRLLSDGTFREQVKNVKKNLDPLLSVSGVAVADLIKHSGSAKQRVDAFNQLYKLMLQFENSTRVEPACFILDGPPGTFKSVTLGKLIPVLGKSVYVHHVKSVADGKDFYDTYDNQEVFYMDDVGQQGKSQWRNLINWVSCIPLPLDCAEASLKNTKLFNSEIILLTTNQFMDLHGFTAQDGIAEPEALFRRAFVFDWSKVKRNRNQIHGEIALKYYDIDSKRWKTCETRQGVSGTYSFASNQGSYISWMASWILSINASKKKHSTKNIVSEEEVDKLKAEIQVFDFDPENDEVELEEYEDAPESIDDYLYDHKGKVAFIPPRNNLLSCVFSQVDEIGFEREEDYIIFSNVQLWTWKDHCRVFFDFLQDSIVSLCTEVWTLILKVLVDPKFITAALLSAGTCLIFGLCATFLNFESQGDEATSTTVDNWTEIRNMVSDSTPSQIDSIVRNNMYEIVVNKTHRSCALAFDKYVLLPLHIVGEKKVISIKLLKKSTESVVLENSECTVVLSDVHNDVAVCRLPRNSPITFKDVSFAHTVPSSFLCTPVGAISVLKIARSDNLGDIPYAFKGSHVFSNVIKKGSSYRIMYDVHFKGLCGSVTVSPDGFVQGMHVAGSNETKAGVALLWAPGVCEQLRALPRSYNGFLVHEKQIPDSSSCRVDAKMFANVPDKSHLVPSPLFGLYDVNRSPANLQKYGKETVWKVFQKSTSQVVDMSPNELEFASEVLDSYLFDFGDITDYQVVKGYDNIAPINMKSSNGYKCLAGKSSYINYELGQLAPFFETELIEMEKGVIDDKVPWDRFIWTESLKDEIRNDEKEGVPRSFRVSTIHQQVWTKRLCADLVSQVLKHRRSNQISIGCNPITEWPLIFEEIKTHGKVFAGDIAKWDGAMVPDVQRAVNKVLLNRYKGRHPEMLSMLLDNIVNSIVVVGNKTVVTTHSMPSGSFLTAFYNSLVNRFYTAMWYFRYNANPSVTGFHRDILDYVYGDDKVVSVRGDEQRLNAETMRDFFQSIGMDFTDASKLPIAQPFQTMGEISFLKRDFVYHNELGKIVCPLALRILFNTISWVDSTKEFDVVVFDKIIAVYRELYLHVDRELLMRDFASKVESVMGPVKWPSLSYLKSLYATQPEEYLIKAFSSNVYV